MQNIRIIATLYASEYNKQDTVFILIYILKLYLQCHRIVKCFTRFIAEYISYTYANIFFIMSWWHF